MEAVAEEKLGEEIDGSFEVVPDQPEATAETPQPAIESPPPQAEDCPPHIREHYDQIREKERDVYALESEYLALKEQAGEAKREFEQADKALRNLIARGPDQQRKLPFEEQAKEPRKPKRIKIVKEIQGEFNFAAGTEHDAIVDSSGDVSIRAGDSDTLELEADEFEVIEWDNGPEPVAENDAWRTAPFAELGLTAKQNDLFEAAGITTIGGLEDLRARIAQNNPDAQWPKGIGPAKVTDIENRVIDWLDKNRDKFGEPVAGADAPQVTMAAQPDEPVIPEPEEKGDVGKALEDAGITAKANGKAKSNGKAKKKAGKSKRR